ncbi:O-antigen ligase family protein [Acinetobacter higginsii]|uniref:O-antigen ligase family protein n=1 Tax=Acinetobacter higginsii TaxID=70347 RepID=UPI0030097E25
MNLNFFKKSILLFVFYLTVFFIGFGSQGTGFINNWDISYSFIYFFIFVSIFLFKDVFLNLNSTITLSVFLMLLSFLVSCFFSTFDNHFENWVRYYSIFSCIIFAYFSYVFMKELNFNPIRFFNLLAVLGLLHVFLLLYMWFNMANPENYNWVSGLYVFGNIRHLADFLSICFLCSLISFFYTNSFLVKIVWIIFSVLILACILWSGSRAAYIGLVPSLFLIIFFQDEKIKNTLLIFIVIFFSIFASLLFQTNNGSLGLFHSINRSLAGDADQMSSGRMWLYKILFEQFSYHPIWGNGGEVIRAMEIYQGKQMLAQAHNSILQVLVEFGVLGFISVLFVAYTLINEFKGKKLNRTQFFCISIISNIIVASFFNGGAYYVVTISLMCLFISIIFLEEYFQVNNKV